MSHPSAPTIPDLLVEHLPRPLVLALEEAALSGARRAFEAVRGIDKGHLPAALGQLRHFHMNETFHRALTIADAAPSALGSNQVVTGRAGLFRVARFNTRDRDWVNGRRSKTRQQMAQANAALSPYASQPDLLEVPSLTEAVVFVVACFAGSVAVQPDAPLSVQIAVPDQQMAGWLFREPLAALLARYDAPWAQAQADLAVPTLKAGVKVRRKGGEAS